MKIATWNVNGIRARESEVRQLIESERPEFLCLQEIKASTVQVPASLCQMEGYWCYWHGGRAYSGVGLHVRKDLSVENPLFSHPGFDYENRIVSVQVGNLIVASVYVPNGGKDFPAKMRFLAAVDKYVEDCHAAGNELLFCGDLNITRRRESPIVSANFRKSAIFSSESLARGWLTSVAHSTLTMISFSPGGLPGVICVSAISAGGLITSWRVHRSREEQHPARC